jgi:hypothetical protein
MKSWAETETKMRGGGVVTSEYPRPWLKEDLVAIAWFMRDKVDYLYRLLEYTLVIILMYICG